jgi:hypothetical protein
MSDLEVEIQSLTETLIFEMTKALTLPQTEQTKKFIRMIFGKAARSFAELGARLDSIVAEAGVAAGARWVLPRFVKSHTARGMEIIPTDGPVVIASNHPAAVDSVVISAYMERPDYKVIIGDIPFFENLPHISQHAIFAPGLQDIQGRMRVIRESIRHLKSGGSLLIFPRGGIEADPDWMPDPGGEFHEWSRSLEIFLEHVPQTKIVATVVSGVIQQKVMQNPLTRLRKNRPDRQRLAFIYQFLRQTLSGKELFGLMPRVTFGEIVEGNTKAHVLAEVVVAARRTLEKHMAWQPAGVMDET